MCTIRFELETFGSTIKDLLAYHVSVLESVKVVYKNEMT